MVPCPRPYGHNVIVSLLVAQLFYILKYYPLVMVWVRHVNLSRYLRQTAVVFGEDSFLQSVSGIYSVRFSVIHSGKDIYVYTIVSLQYISFFLKLFKCLNVFLRTTTNSFTATGRNRYFYHMFIQDWKERRQEKEIFWPQELVISINGIKFILIPKNQHLKYVYSWILGTFLLNVACKD